MTSGPPALDRDVAIPASELVVAAVLLGPRPCDCPDGGALEKNLILG